MEFFSLNDNFCFTAINCREFGFQTSLLGTNFRKSRASSFPVVYLWYFLVHAVQQSVKALPELVINIEQTPIKTLVVTYSSILFEQREREKGVTVVLVTGGATRKCSQTMSVGPSCQCNLFMAVNPIEVTPKWTFQSDFM